jgi:hypothetical protein
VGEQVEGLVFAAEFEVDLGDEELEEVVVFG